MKKLAIIAALAALASCNFVQVSGSSSSSKSIKASDNIITKTFDTGTFSGLECNVAAKIEFTQAPEASVEITTSDNILEYLDVSVRGSELRIAPRKGYRFKNLGTFSVKVSAPSLEEVEINGAGTFTAPFGIKSDSFALEMNGAAKIDICGLEARKVGIELNGAADCTVKGLLAGEVEAEVNGAGNCTLAGKADSVDAEINGVGNIDVSALEAGDIKTKLNGVGTVR